MQLMRTLLPPLCLLLALACVIGGFALIAVPPPEPDVELHKARASGDDRYRDVLESDLEARRWRRRAMIGGAFAGAILFTAAAFLAMRPPR